MMKKTITILATTLLLIAGCSSTVKIVKVPVPVQPPRVEIPARPVLMVPALPATPPPESKYSELVRAVEFDYARLIEYSLKLERLLQAYNKGIDQKYLEGMKSEITVHSE